MTPNDEMDLTVCSGADCAQCARNAEMFAKDPNPNWCPAYKNYGWDVATDHRCVCGAHS